jgi:hypothetical protein
MRSFTFASLLLTLLFGAVLFNGCALADRKKVRVKTLELETGYKKGRGDAYLFDIKINRDGKKNSVRLEVFHSGDSLGIFARGYLGKGVLKGLILPDSAVMYFPGQDEFYSGSLIDLIGDDCADSMFSGRIVLDLFDKTPSELSYPLSGHYINIVEEGPEVRRYWIQSKKCPEEIELEYDLQGGKSVLKRIEYRKSSGDFGLEASRRQIRLDIGIPSEKMRIDIPPTALRLNP